MRLPLHPIGIAVVLGGLGALLLLPVVLFLLGFAYYHFPGRILPNVRVSGVPVAGMSVQEAAILLHKTQNLEGHITISDGFKNWEARPADLGLELDPLESAQLAFIVGHGDSFFGNAETFLFSLTKGKEITPIVRLNPEQAKNAITSWQSYSSNPPKNATLVVEGDRIVVKPGEVGYTINMEESLASLAADPTSTMLSGQFRLSLKPVPPLVEDLAEMQAKAAGFLNQPFSVKAYDPISGERLEWSPERAELVRWLEITNHDGGAELRISPAEIERYLNELSSSLGQARYLEMPASLTDYARNIEAGSPPILRVRHQPTRYTVQPGDTLLRISWRVGIPYWRIEQANPGINADALSVGRNLVIPSKDDMLPLPVVPNKRVVISISRQRLWTYQDGSETGEYVISTGIDKSPTQPGVFQVQTHELSAYASVWDLTMPNFLGIYEAWPGFMNGIHGLPTLSNGRILWAGALGKPTSYGCIIVDLKAAENLYNWAENGVVVEIQP